MHPSSLQRSTSTVALYNHQLPSPPENVNSLPVVRVTNTQSGHTPTSRALDIYGIDAPPNKKTQTINRYLILVKNWPNDGAYICKAGRNDRGDFEWINPSILKKYQTNNLTQVNLTEKNLNQLQETYKNSNTTKFLADLLASSSAQPLDPVYTHVFQKNPQAFFYSAPFESGNGFLIYPNIPYMSEAYTSDHYGELATRREGVQLTAWAVHPKLPQDLVREITRTQQMDSASRETTNEFNQKNIEVKSGVKSLTSILDLDHNDIEMLEQLKTDVIMHLEDSFGASPFTDNIDLFFHFPVATITATLHLHIWVNKGNHPLNESRAFSIDEVIDHLKNGENINKLILSRNEGQFILPQKDALHLINGMPGSHPPTQEARESLSLPI